MAFWRKQIRVWVESSGSQTRVLFAKRVPFPKLIRTWFEQDSNKCLKKDKNIELSIIDNGIGRQKANEYREKKTFKKDSLGIEFAKERLNYFNKKEKYNYQFAIEDLVDSENHPSGTKVIFRFTY
jgi:hypothetical protein